MDCVNVKNLGCTNDGGDVQVASSRRRRPNAGGFVSVTHMKRITIDVAVNSYRANAHLFAGPDNATGNFTAVGDQYLLEFSGPRVHLLSKSKVQSRSEERRVGKECRS